MPFSLLSFALSGLGRDALKVAAGLVLAVLLALAMTISSLSALLGALGPVHTAPGVQPGDARPERAGDPVDGATGDRVVALARTQLGRPYVWGGASPETSFDCSGLVQWVYRQSGIGLPRTAQQQFDATARLTPEQLEPGDLLFFRDTYPSVEPITHVGVYVGGGLMVNAPSTGDVVREMPAFGGYWGAHFAGAGRVRS